MKKRRVIYTGCVVMLTGMLMGCGANTEANNTRGDGKEEVQEDLSSNALKTTNIPEGELNDEWYDPEGDLYFVLGDEEDLDFVWDDYEGEFSEDWDVPTIVRNSITSVLEGDTLILSGEGILDNVNLDKELKKHGLSRETLKKVTVSEGITEIQNAFSECSSLEEVIILSPMERLGGGAFRNCTGLKEVILPDSITQIGDMAFQRCESLKSIVLPKNLQRINSMAFSSAGLEKIIFPEGLKSIGSHAFLQNNFTSVILPEGVEQVEDSAFAFCYDVTEVSLPESLVYIGPKAFYYSSALKSIKLPSNLSYLGSMAFGKCKELTSELPEFSYKMIGEDEILFCGWVKENNSLITYQIPEILYGRKVVGVGDYAFDYFENLKEVEFSEATRVIGDKAFQGCSSLEMTEVPKGVTKIGEYAFSSCSKLKEMVLPEGVTELGHSVFMYCDGLKSITVPKSVREIGFDTFRTFGDTIVYCKKGSYAEEYAKQNGINYVAE